MSKDYIAKELNWLDDIMTHKDNSSLFTDENKSMIQNEISVRWTKENRLDLLNDLARKFGEDDVFFVIDKIIWSNSIRNWEEVGKKTNNTFDNFLKILWEPLKKIGFQYTYEKKGDSTIFNVTKCPIADAVKKLNAEKWFFHLVCLIDEPTILGFNNCIKFSRSKTLMQGDEICDHCYT
jgi:hypothetical protein